ncbi:MAG: CBS domain-containing protein [Proteobacteria bacterium]|nr:CBS domain-containing protein [Pseudomonadota bacterium]
MLVADLMTANPKTVTPEDSLGDVVALMSKHNIRELPVVENGELTGIITERDVKMALGPDARSMHIDTVDPRQLDGSVEWFMTASAHTIDVDATAAEAVERVLELRVGALPVVDGDDLVGILSVTDLLRASLPLFR